MKIGTILAVAALAVAGCGKKDTNTITVWVAENVVDFTKEKVNFKIKGAHKEAFSDERVQVRIKE